MSEQFVVRADDIIEQILIQCWLFQARGGDLVGARRNAERTLERLLAKGLPHARDSGGLRLDPYAANNMIKARAGELDDEAWGAWQDTARRNALSLPTEPHRYRFRMRREWHADCATPGRPLLLRLPVPLRQAQLGSATVRLLEPENVPVEIRELPGSIGLRLNATHAKKGPVVAELEVDLLGTEHRDTGAAAAPLGAAPSAQEQLWLRDHEGLVVRSPAVCTLAHTLAQGCADAREFVHAVWRWLISQLRFGDVHRSDLEPADPLGGLLRSRRADCVLGSSLLVALCRARGIPARLLSGYLLHPANPGPHSWAEVRLAADSWVPFDFGSWCYCAGDPDMPGWGSFYRGRVDARLIAEIAPREFTGWGSARPPPRWFRLERLQGDQMVHSLHTLPDGALFRRDVLDLRIVGPAGPHTPAP